MNIPTPPRSLKIGAIIDKTLGVLEHSMVPALIYLAGLTLVNGAITYFALNRTAPMDLLAVWLAQFAVGVVGGYLLLTAMVDRTGLRSRHEGDVFLPYCGLSTLYTLGVIAGLIVIIFPGLFIMARWSIAQPMLIARGEGVRRSLGESWERTRGAEFAILAAALALMIPLIVVVIACSMLFEPTDPMGIGATQFGSTAVSVVLLAMGVALYGMIEGKAAAAAFE